MDNQTPQLPPQNVNTSTEFWGHLRLGFLLLGVFILTIYGKCAHNHNNEIETPKKDTISSTHVKLKDKAKKDTESYIPPEGGVTITPKDKSKSLEDIINVHKTIMGITFEPGLSMAFPMYPSIGLDAKLLYYERWGAGAGVLGGTGLTTGFSPYIFVSRRIDDKLSLFKNTEVWAGYVPFSKIPAALGIRINL